MTLTNRTTRIWTQVFRSKSGPLNVKLVRHSDRYLYSVSVVGISDTQYYSFKNGFNTHQCRQIADKSRYDDMPRGMTFTFLL